MNEIAATILEILKYTIPSGIVFVTAYFMLRAFFEEQNQRNKAAGKQVSQAAEAPITGSNITITRLQAYERLILLLERIEPNQMVPRIHKPGANAAMFARELQSTIRTEYEHNLTQQIYVSELAWNKVQESKTAINQLIDLAAKKVGDNATGVQLSNALFTILGAAGVSPTADAIKILRTEARQLL
ncbi:MAG: hypothetical protein ACPGU4_09050 [Flavobacteriales bacterium]